MLELGRDWGLKPTIFLLVFDVTKRLDSTSRQYGMEISSKKSKVMVTSRQGNKDTDKDIKVNIITLETVESFKYLGSILNEEATSLAEIKTRLAIATAQVTKLNNIWNNKKIQLKTKIKLMHSLITSIALYGCESWTFTKQLERRMNAFEQRCFRRLIGITFRDHRTNASVVKEITAKVGAYEPPLEFARRRKLQWFGHISRQPGSLVHTIMHGSIEEFLRQSILHELDFLSKISSIVFQESFGLPYWKKLYLCNAASSVT